jgi:putative tricarboxylic transport membrane protein
MELLSQVIVSVLQWQNLIALLSGSLFGIIIGILPGLGPSAGMALVLPFVLKWEPVTALIFIGTLYKCSNYGGSITAILVNTPGDAANAATVMDGYPLCEKGKAGIALGLSATGAMVGHDRDALPYLYGALSRQIRFAVRAGRILLGGRHRPFHHCHLIG